MQWLCSSLHKETKILKIVLPEIKKKTLEKLFNCLTDCCTNSDTVFPHIVSSLEEFPHLVRKLFKFSLHKGKLNEETI